MEGGVEAALNKFGVAEQFHFSALFGNDEPVVPFVGDSIQFGVVSGKVGGQFGKGVVGVGVVAAKSYFFIGTDIADNPVLYKEIAGIHRVEDLLVMINVDLFKQNKIIFYAFHEPFTVKGDTFIEIGHLQGQIFPCFVVQQYNVSVGEMFFVFFGAVQPDDAVADEVGTHDKYGVFAFFFAKSFPERYSVK